MVLDSRQKLNGVRFICQYWMLLGNFILFDNVSPAKASSTFKISFFNFAAGETSYVIYFSLLIANCILPQLIHSQLWLRSSVEARAGIWKDMALSPWIL